MTTLKYCRIRMEPGSHQVFTYCCCHCMPVDWDLCCELLYSQHEHETQIQKSAIVTTLKYCRIQLESGSIKNFPIFPYLCMGDNIGPNKTRWRAPEEPKLQGKGCNGHAIKLQGKGWLPNSILPGLLFVWWKAARFLATSFKIYMHKCICKEI